MKISFVSWSTGNQHFAEAKAASHGCTFVCFAALWQGVQQDAQPDGPHASPLRQQALQMPLLSQQVHAEGEPHQAHEGQARRVGQRVG